MWCAQCQSDVATEVAADGQSLLCTTCGGEVRKVFAPSLHPDVQRARDVLARLSKNTGENKAEGANPAAGRVDALKPEAAAGDQAIDDEPSESIAVPRPVSAKPPADSRSAASEPARDERPQAAARRQLEPGPAADGSDKPAPTRQFRIDAAHPVAERARAHVPHASPSSRESERPIAVAAPVRRRDDAAHAAIPPPHFEVAAAARKTPPGRSESTWGQLLAYLGVAVLTVGTALVLWGYFGGPPAYAPTGWLVTTAGQMLLLLGVITLVSGGMQQTTHEVASRVAHLDGRMHRIETTAHELLHGPHFGRARSGASQRESAQQAGEAEE